MINSTNETRQIERHTTCNSTMIECKKCNKQYTGKTKRTLHERFTEHRRASNTCHANSSTAVPSHFTLPGHWFHCRYKSHIFRRYTTYHKAGEAYLISKRKPLRPNGLNRRDEQWNRYHTPFGTMLYEIIRLIGIIFSYLIYIGPTL